MRTLTSEIQKIQIKKDLRDQKIYIIARARVASAMPTTLRFRHDDWTCRTRHALGSTSARWTALGAVRRRGVAFASAKLSARGVLRRSAGPPSTAPRRV